MIGYLVEQELGNLVPFEKPLATLLTMIEVDIHDPAFEDPSKPIGPIYDRATAESLAAERGWTVKPDGDHFRRVVPSPRPRRIFELRQIKWLLEKGTVVICAGGGGIPVMYAEHTGPAMDGGPDRQLVGVEAVIDKDLASSLLAGGIEADYFAMATDADAAYVDWGTPTARAIARAHPDAIDALASEFAAGSMLPKVQAACEFARASGHRAAIGGLQDISEMLAGRAGTHHQHGGAGHHLSGRLSPPIALQLPAGTEEMDMPVNLRNRSFLKEIDFAPTELRFLLQLSADLKAAKVRGHGGAPTAGQDHRPHLREDLDAHALRLRGGRLRPGRARHVSRPVGLADGPQGIGRRHGPRARAASSTASSTAASRRPTSRPSRRTPACPSTTG